MYATKPLSLFKSQPEAASGPPPEGRNSGYLVVKGAADEETRFWGLLPDRRVRELPFPQNCVLKVRYTVNNGQNGTTTREEAVVFVPVPDQPLASNRYYAIIAKGKRKGLVRAPFHPADIYQQLEIVRRRRGWFTARAVAPDAFPSSILRHKYWRVYASGSRKFNLGEAPGLDVVLRSSQLAVADTAAAVGRWYSPFFLVKEAGVAPRGQMERSAFYEVTLEQRWVPVHQHGGGSKLGSRKALVGGVVEAEQESLMNSRQGDGYVWFKAAATGQVVGVCTSMWERMLWEQYRGGWVDEEEDAGKVAGGWVLVERFVVKRLDGRVVVAFEFVHLNKVRATEL
ncbi:hypothetical protein HU200_033310 [Digitaria exilis]|uniref:Uncharacterized protein n=1 Tax=Digitaria exilis TaxID=1010633 RepID=A0A835BXM7_9POAL|nr:hypothetical protein HU200_033310 [Digitaria exilis]